jgi:YXWGXW repeat-containing protein
MNIHRLVSRKFVRGLVLAAIVLSISAASFAQVFVSVRFGPPALPIYAQPICPGPGYYWTPGYWAWNDEGGYYWVPGTWVVAPVGMLWTPGYWGWGGGFYLWHAGYWGPHIGFYGGINYGFGYTGVGFVGGEWRGGGFYYNRAVTNVSVTNVTNVYNKTVVVNNTTVNNVSYNGGTGGVTAQPTSQELAAEHEQHTAPLAAQTQHETLASQNHQNFASVNQGRPAIAATSRAGDFSGHSVIAARAAGAEYHAPAMTPQQARGPSTPMRTNASEGFRPFTPPGANNSQNGSPNGASQNNGSQNKGAQNNPMYQEKGTAGSNPLYESKDKTVSAPPSNPPKGNTSKPPSQPHKSSTPPPHHGNPPKEDHHKGR